MEGKVISIANHKGGVGKTTTCASLSYVLSQKGYKVLMVDLDPQANLTASFMTEESELTIYDAMVDAKHKTQLPIVNIRTNLDIVPSSEQLAMADMSLAQRAARENILKKLIKPHLGNYDYVFIDCPPSLGILTLNAFTASDSVIVPIVAEVLPFKGLVMIENFLKEVKEELNGSVKIDGILICRWELTKLSKQIEEGLRSQDNIPVYKTKIRKNISVAEAPLMSQNIVEYAPKSNGAKDYVAFADEFLAVEKKN